MQRKSKEKIFRTEEAWQAALNEMKSDLGLTDQKLAALLGSSVAIVNKVRGGLLNMPVTMKLHMLVQSGYASVRDMVMAVIPPDLSLQIQEIEFSAESGRELRNLPAEVAQSLADGEELMAWNMLLDEARERFGSDVKVGQLIGASKSMVGIARQGISRLTPTSKAQLIKILDYRFQDEVLMSLLQIQGYNYLRELCIQKKTD